MARRLTQDDINLIMTIYKEEKTYAATARATGFSASTVRKYVDLYKDKPIEVVSVTGRKRIFYEDVPPMSETQKIFEEENEWGMLCRLTDEERDEIKELWKEMLL